MEPKPPEKTAESTEKTAEESPVLSTEKPTGPRGDFDAAGPSSAEREKEVVQSTTPEAPLQASGDHVSSATAVFLASVLYSSD